MNYLAHLHIADLTRTSLIGNLLGDFVKGDPRNQFDQTVSTGIQLHRFVDSYIDQHPAVIDTKGLFTGSARRFSGIALDMFWDHCLANHWSDYHNVALEQFCRSCETEIGQFDTHQLPHRFVEVNRRIWLDGWLLSYRELNNIEFALAKISTRSPRLADLTLCFPYLDKHYDELNKVFHSVYPQIMSASLTHSRTL